MVSVDVKHHVYLLTLATISLIANFVHRERIVFPAKRLPCCHRKPSDNANLDVVARCSLDVTVFHCISLFHVPVAVVYITVTHDDILEPCLSHTV